jgi:carbamoyltransferase
MVILGFTGSINSPQRNELKITHLHYHDAAAALIVDGKVVSAAEEERFNRIKHTNKFPYNAIKYVLEDYGIGLADVDYICYYFEEDFMNCFLKDSFSSQNVKDISI